MSVHSKCMSRASSRPASRSMILMAWPELTPGGAAVDRGGRVHVVARQHQRAVDFAMLASEPSGTMPPSAVADFEPRDVLESVAELRVGLDDDLPGAAEEVEIVDVERALVDPQRVGEVLERDTPHGHALPRSASTWSCGTLARKRRTGPCRPRRRRLPGCDEILGLVLQAPAGPRRRGPRPSS